MCLKPVLLMMAGTSCLILSACGGSSSSTNVGYSVPGGSSELFLTTHAISATASITQAAGPTATLGLTPLNAPSGAYIGYAYSTNGVATIVGNQPVHAPSALIVTFQPPYQLKPGTYTDSLQIELCADSECIQQLTQRQFVTLTYVVTAPAAGQSPTVTLSPGSVSAQQFLTSMPIGLPETPRVTVSFANVPVAPSVTTSITGSSVETATYSAAANAIGGSLTVFLKPPQQLGAGVYHDSVTINACLDTHCNNPLPPATLNITYTVTNTVAGANGYTIDAWPITATDLLWDAVNSHLLVALPPGSGSTSGSIAILDPVSGALSAPTSITGTPGVMAIAADSSYLYVGLRGSSSIQRYALPAMTPDITIPLPAGNGNATFARTIEVAPDDAHTIAVTLQDAAGSPMGLVVFDDATARANTFGFVNVTPVKVIDSAVWGATGAALFGTSTPVTGQAAELYGFTVTAAGVALITDQPGGPGGREHFAQNLLYLDSGAIVDPVSLTTSAAFVAPKSNLLMTPDVTLTRAFFLNTATASSSFSGVQFESYDLDTQGSIATVPAPNGNPTAARLIRWGSAGLAFVDSTNNDIVTVSGSFVSP
jgi:hypothetical protein